MKVSVIIPAINEASLVTQTITSAVAAGADEVILVDGGSADETVPLARAAGATVVSAPAGRATQQNAGAESAAGDVLLFLHADCRLPPTGISDIRARLTNRPEFVGGWFRQRIDAPGILFRMIESGNLLRAKNFKWVYGDQAIFVRRDVFEHIGGFPAMPLMEDLYLMKQLKRQGPLTCIDAPVIVSARRWKKRGTVFQTVRNWMMLIAVHLGVPPGTLARFYPRTT